jgi:hypothetical protein
MKTFFADASAVVIANDVNLSIFKPPWFSRTGIFTDAELTGEIVISPVMVRVPTDEFEFMVFPNRFQMTFKGLPENGQESMDRVLGSIVNTLPHTPYSGVGLNFNHLVSPNAEDSFFDWCKKEFSCNTANKACPNEPDDARYGCYVSRDVLGGRLKLTIMPTRIANRLPDPSADWQVDDDVMRVAFNYDFKVEQTDPDSVCDQVTAILAKWTDVAEDSKRTVAAMFNQ